MFSMDVIILTFSMPQFPDHGLELVERQATLSKAGQKEKQELWQANIVKLNEEKENSFGQNISL